MHIIYLHGFASSVHSTKGTFLARKFRELGIEVHMPDFNLPEFASLTITRMVQQVEAILDGVPPGPVALIGSSLGGFVAVQVALRRRIDRLVLLAPALEFAADKLQAIGDKTLPEWEKKGSLNVFHFGYGRMMPLNYSIYQDCLAYQCANAQLAMPIQILQGRRDTVVDPAAAERWASTRPNVELVMLDDDHQLGASLDTIWRATSRFLNIEPGSPRGPHP